jgi:hypothetical protein
MNFLPQNAVATTRASSVPSVRVSIIVSPVRGQFAVPLYEQAHDGLTTNRGGHRTEATVGTEMTSLVNYYARQVCGLVLFLILPKPSLRPASNP